MILPRHPFNAFFESTGRGVPESVNFDEEIRDFVVDFIMTGMKDEGRKAFADKLGQKQIRVRSPKNTRILANFGVVSWEDAICLRLVPYSAL
ncbi:MAG: hypothetical protein GY822_02890 [Deltaproteobacteria bacterium]|nr:hypothetical protein [Deltaproteobacteria bacterium]